MSCLNFFPPSPSLFFFFERICSTSAPHCDLLLRPVWFPTATQGGVLQCEQPYLHRPGPWPAGSGATEAARHAVANVSFSPVQGSVVRTKKGLFAGLLATSPWSIGSGCTLDP